MNCRTDAARTAHLDPGWAHALATDDDHPVRSAAACNPSLPTHLLRALATDPQPQVRAAAATHPALPLGLVPALTADPDGDVRLNLSVHPALTEQQRQTIDYTVAARRYPFYDWIVERHGAPAEMRRLAASSHVLIRRTVAAARRLPADVVAALAADEDFFVRLTLAHHNDDAPADFMVDTYAAWDGKFAFLLPRRPTFPTNGMARYADHPDPRLRELAVRNPNLPVPVMHLMFDVAGL